MADKEAYQQKFTTVTSMLLLTLWCLPSWITLVSTLLVILIIKEIMDSRSHRNRLLAKIPGPNYPSIIYSITIGFGFIKDKCNLTTTATRLVREYGGFVKVWIMDKPVIVISKPEHLKTFFTSASTLDRSTVYAAVESVLGNSLLLAKGNDWKIRRKMFLNNFVSTPTEKLLKNVLEIKEDMFEMLRKREDGKFFSCKLFLSKTTLKGIQGIAFNTKLGEELEDEIIHKFHDTIANLYSAIAFVETGFKKLFCLTTNGKVLRKAAEFLNNTFRSLVLKEKQIIESLKADGSPLLDIYINKLIERNNDNIELLTEETTLLVGAALDTTAHTMAYVLLIMGILPDVQENVYQEAIREYKRQDGKEITVDDVKNYEYLYRVINETLRLFPVTGVNGRFLSEDTYFGEYLVPAGTEVFYNIVYTNYNAEYFKEPRKFIPERFLPENKKRIPPYTFNPFNNGPRICPGRRYSMMAMTVFLSAIVKKYRITSQYKTLDELIDNACYEVMTFDKNDYMVRLERRD